MIRHIEAAPVTVHDKLISILWDDEAGTVSGDGAEYIREIAGWGECNAHPQAWSHQFSPEPLKSMEDMAAIIGWRHRVPDWLLPYYPKVDDEEIPDVPGGLITY